MEEILLIYEPGSKLLVLGMVIQPLIGNPYNGYINPYYWVDDHPLLYLNIGSLDPSTYGESCGFISSQLVSLITKKTIDSIKIIVEYPLVN